jgi:hypothetical protein
MRPEFYSEKIKAYCELFANAICYAILCNNKKNTKIGQELTFPQKCENGFDHPVVLVQTATAGKQGVIGIECKHFDATRPGVCLRRAMLCGRQRELARLQEGVESAG